MLTDFENFFTIGSSDKLPKSKCNSFRHLLKTSLHCRVKHKTTKSAFALLILDDKSTPNFYGKFVNC